MDQTLQAAFSVDWRYEVRFTEGAFRPENPALLQAVATCSGGRRSRLAFLVEEAVAAAHPKLVESIHAYSSSHAEALELVFVSVMPGGESCKTPERLWPILEAIHEAGLCRHSYLVAVGGGAFLDLAGFAAAIAHRGLRHIRLPTTTLAQNDAGVGVKNGLNLFGKKNFIGAFAPPCAVLCDFEFIRTLERRERVGGVAEAFKVAMIKDAEFFAWLARNAQSMADAPGAALAEMIVRCAEIHLRHIADGGDPFEFGSARPLDFGHWAAHKLESLGAGVIRHGEAVAVGLCLDSLYAVKTGLLGQDSFDILIDSFLILGLPVWSALMDLPGSDGAPAFIDGISEFREHLGGDLRITLPDGLGRRREVDNLDSSLILECAAALKLRRLLQNPLF